jgi:hypothetical protein
MKLRGVNYDVGIQFTPRYHSRPVFDPAATERDLIAIRDELHANAVRISGTDPRRLAAASRTALDLGLQVWFSPHLHDRGPDELVAYTAECAALAEELRRDAPRLVFLVGCELTLFSSGILKGDNVLERLRNPLTLVRLKWFGTHNKPLNALLARLEKAVRARFAGPVTYASVPLEAVDWSRFDYLGIDYIPRREEPGQLWRPADPTVRGRQAGSGHRVRLLRLPRRREQGRDGVGNRRSERRSAALHRHLPS